MKNIPQAYRPSYLWFWPPLILGGSVISAGTIHDLRRVKVPGTGPLWNPCLMVSEIRGQRKIHPKCFLWFPYEVPFCICFENFLSIDDFCWTINVFSKNCEGISTFWLQLFSTAPCPVFLFKWQFQLLLNSFCFDTNQYTLFIWLLNKVMEGTLFLVRLCLAW